MQWVSIKEWSATGRWGKGGQFGQDRGGVSFTLETVVLRTLRRNDFTVGECGEEGGAPGWMFAPGTSQNGAARTLSVIDVRPILFGAEISGFHAEAAEACAHRSKRKKEMQLLVSRCYQILNTWRFCITIGSLNTLHVKNLI